LSKLEALLNKRLRAAHPQAAQGDGGQRKLPVM
jgi:hypothetical protein